jgi:hypothetical protein
LLLCIAQVTQRGSATTRARQQPVAAEQHNPGESGSQECFENHLYHDLKSRFIPHAMSKTDAWK